MKRLMLAVLCLASALPVLAADDFDKGCALYNSGKYNLALPILQETVRKRPGYWAGHYYLGHTYLALGQRSSAIQEYETCQNCKGAAPVAAACQSVIDRLNRSAARQGMPDPATFSKAYQAQRTMEKQHVMDVANREANEQRDRVNKTLSSANDVLYPQVIDQDKKRREMQRDKEVQLETEKKLEPVMDKARARARDIK
jgi:tetratricopeptide (TPR) repeat protein